MYTVPALRKLLGDVKNGRLRQREALERLVDLPYESLTFARLDHHRAVRKGFPEAIFAPGKSSDQLCKIARAMARTHQCFLITKLNHSRYLKVRSVIPELEFSEEGQLAFYRRYKRKPCLGPVAVLTAGTSDIPVAEEAVVTLALMGIRAVRIFDCGVAGLHRLLDQVKKLRKTKAIICIAGMEGALASVLGGLTDRPIVAVPTSVGYGASFKGITPLLTMLSSCAPGVAVVNIDNGYGAACFIKQILVNKK